MSWYLSLEMDDVPTAQKILGQRTHRSITIDGDEMNFPVALMICTKKL